MIHWTRRSAQQLARRDWDRLLLHHWDRRGLGVRPFIVIDMQHGQCEVQLNKSRCPSASCCHLWKGCVNCNMRVNEQNCRQTWLKKIDYYNYGRTLFFNSELPQTETLRICNWHSVSNIRAISDSLWLWLNHTKRPLTHVGSSCNGRFFFFPWQPRRGTTGRWSACQRCVAKEGGPLSPESV